MTAMVILGVLLPRLLPGSTVFNPSSRSGSGTLPIAVSLGMAFSAGDDDPGQVLKSHTLLRVSQELVSVLVHEPDCYTPRSSLKHLGFSIQPAIWYKSAHVAHVYEPGYILAL
eukprot:1421216-Karenia_brevis.AAC.1